MELLIMYYHQLDLDLMNVAFTIGCALVHRRGGVCPPECIHKYTIRSAFGPVTAKENTHCRGGMLPPKCIHKVLSGRFNLISVKLSSLALK